MNNCSILKQVPHANIVCDKVLRKIVSLVIEKNNLPHFRKTLESVVDPRLTVIVSVGVSGTVLVSV